jgi:hypothetical protein
MIGEAKSGVGKEYEERREAYNDTNGMKENRKQIIFFVILDESCVCISRAHRAINISNRSCKRQWIHVLYLFSVYLKTLQETCYIASNGWMT